MQARVGDYVEIINACGTIMNVKAVYSTGGIRWLVVHDLVDLQHKGCVVTEDAARVNIPGHETDLDHLVPCPTCGNPMQMEVVAYITPGLGVESITEDKIDHKPSDRRHFLCECCGKHIFSEAKLDNSAK